MKVLVALCVLALVTLSFAKPHVIPNPRGCRWALSTCLSECEEGTHSYAMGCSYRVREATCDEPNPQPWGFMMCDYSDCYCDEPTVRDKTTGKCVTLDKCPQKE